MINSIKSKFYPPKDYFRNLPIREQEQLSLVVGSNLVFMLLFAIFGITLFSFHYYVIGIGGLFLLAFFVTSLLLIKKCHIQIEKDIIQEKF